MKSITIDATIENRLRTHLKGDVPAFDTIVVFEATVLSTRPLRKAGTVWEDATITRATLGEMASYVNEGNQVPLHTLHVSQWELPVGRFFYGEVFDQQDGHSELRALFYIPKTEEKYIKDIEAGVIEALSVGVSTKALLCSECGWDYLGEESDYVNLVERTCANGHEIGKDGIHAVGAGLKLWRETSLVSLGASKDAAIHSRSKSRLAPAQLTRLAAAQGTKDITLLATVSQIEEPEMDLAELVAKVEANAAANAELTASNQALTTELTAANESVTALQAEVADLKTQLEAAQAAVPADNTAELTAAQADASASLTFLQAQAVKALIASGQENPAAPETIAECIAAIETSGKNLVNLLADAGNSVAADANLDNRSKPTVLGAFKSRKA